MSSIAKIQKAAALAANKLGFVESAPGAGSDEDRSSGCGRNDASISCILADLASADWLERTAAEPQVLADDSTGPWPMAADGRPSCPGARDMLEAHVADPRFKAWIRGTHVTDDGTPEGKPVMVFRGCREGHSDVTPGNPAYWLTSSRMSAAFYDEGEILSCFVRLVNPLVLTAEQVIESGKTPSELVSEARAQCLMGMADWDGVIFENVRDGTHPSNIYAVFPKSGGISHAVQVVGATNYFDKGENAGLPIYFGLQPSAEPLLFDRMDRVGTRARSVEVAAESMIAA